jgi:CHASE2 domain-containing sensor protein
LQPLELAVYDQMLTARPQEPGDSRILVVTVTEADVKAQFDGKGSLSDRSLDQLLAKLEGLKPQSIGLDIYRDFPVGKGFPQLAARLKQSDRFIGICRSKDPLGQVEGIAPPPEVGRDRLGFSNFVTDRDRGVRRQLLALEPGPDSACPADYALSSQLALGYLEAQGITLQVSPAGVWQLGKARFAPLESHGGGYQGIDAWGYQVLLNYRNYRSPGEVAPRVTLQEALAGALTPETVQDRIVLIGTTAASFQDVSITPYRGSNGDRQTIPGVMMQAQMVSQLLSAAMDGRPMLRVLPWGDELGMLLSGTLGAGLAAVWWRRVWRVRLGVLGLVGSVYLVAMVGFVGLAIWLPVVPMVLTGVLGAGLLSSKFVQAKLPP